MIKKLSILLIIFTVGITAYSQMMNIPDTVNILNEVSISAPKRITETVSNMQKIESIIIENKIGTDLSALLAENTPVFIKSKGKGSMASASFRGTNSSHTQVLWNNIPLNSPSLGMVDLSLIPTGISDEICLYFGASSLQKSGGALGGLIDLKTNATWEKNFKLNLLNSVGSYKSYTNSASLQIGNNLINSVTKIYRNSSENNFEFINNDIIDGSAQTQQNADYKQLGALQELYFRTGKNSTADIKVWYQEMDRGIPTLTTNETGINNNISRQIDKTLIVSSGYSYYLDNIKFDLASGINSKDMSFNNSNNINGLGYLKVVDSESSYFSLYNSVSINHKISDKFEYKIKTGYNYHSVNTFEQIRSEGYDTCRNELFLTASIYSQITNKLSLGIISRQEKYDDEYSGFIPSLFTEYEINEKIKLKSSVARNTKYPNLNELYFTPGGNPELVHEQGWQFETGTVFKHLNDKVSLQSGFSFFYSKIHDWILWRPTNMGFWQPDNIELVVAKGFETNLNLKYKIKTIDFNINANYSFTSSINKSQAFGVNDNSIGKQLPYIPKHSANLLLRSDYKKYFITYQWNYYSERYTGSAAEPGILVSIYPYFMNDISVGRNFSINKTNCNISFYIYNILNESYRSVLWQPMPGRNFKLQLIINI